MYAGAILVQAYLFSFLKQFHRFRSEWVCPVLFKYIAMRNSRSYILEESYKLFLCRNVEKVTISELEKETKKIRGTIFYHFNDKLNLFNCIVHEIFLPQLDIPTQMRDAALNVSFATFIESYKSPEERAIEIMKKRYHIPEAEMCYFNFLSQAYKYSPDFQKQYTQVFFKEIQIWKTVIDRNKKSDISIDCDSHILANIVILFKTGVFYAKGHTDIPKIDYDNTLAKLYDCLIK